MKYLTNHSLITLSVGMSLAACAASADDEGARASAPGVSAEVAGNGARASAGPVEVKTAQLALDELSGYVDTTVDGFHTRSVPPPPDAQPAAPPGADATQDINVSCAAGGDARGDAAVGGYVNVQPAPVSVDVKLAIAFNNCAMRSGSTINGNVDFSQSVVVAGPETPLQVETLYQGEVSLTGRVNVSCPVDLNVLVDETGRALKVAGMFCNQDASELTLQLQPRWQTQ